MHNNIIGQWIPDLDTGLPLLYTSSQPGMLQLLQFCCCCQRQKGAGWARRFHTFNFCWQFSRIVLLQTIKQQICAKYWNRIDEILLILKGFQVDLFVWTSNMSPSHLRSTFYFTLKYCGRCVHLSPSSSCDMIKIVNTKQHDSVPGCWVARQGSNLALLTACILYSALSSQGVYRGGGR